MFVTIINMFIDYGLYRCIPYKVRKGYEEHSIEDRLEVLMVSTPNRCDLVFPKVSPLFLKIAKKNRESNWKKNVVV